MLIPYVVEEEPILLKVFANDVIDDKNDDYPLCDLSSFEFMFIEKEELLKSLDELDSH